MLYVLRFAGGPEGNMPTTFCWTTPVDNTYYVRNEENMHWVHAVICVKNVTKQGSMHCVCVCVEKIFRCLVGSKKKFQKYFEMLQLN